jgi:hypothetical protein
MGRGGGLPERLVVDGVVGEDAEELTHRRPSPWVTAVTRTPPRDHAAASSASVVVGVEVNASTWAR